MEPRLFFAIRHKPTAGFIPVSVRGASTWVEPSSTLAPRLFTKRQYAIYAMRQYVRGKLTRERTKFSLDIFGNGDEEPGNIVVHEDSARDPNDFEVVQLAVSLHAPR